MKPKILVTRKLSDGAEEKLEKNFDVTLNLEDEPISNEKLIDCLLYTSPSPRD